MPTSSPEQVERALLLLALNGGAIRPTIRQLAEQGHTSNHHTLKRWRDETHRDRYMQILHDERKKIAERIASEQEEFARLAIQEERALLQEIAKARERGEIPARDLAGALRNVSTSKGIALDKSGELRGRPSVIVEHRNPDEIIAKLDRLAPGLIVEATAEEIEPGETAPGGANSIPDAPLHGLAGAVGQDSLS